MPAAYSSTCEERTPLLINVESHVPRSNVTIQSQSRQGKLFSPKSDNQLSSDGTSSTEYPHDEDLFTSARLNFKKARRKLIIACIICLHFMVAECVGGYLANSLAIMTDAAHLLSDFSGFLISLLAIWLATRPSTSKMSYGWHRAEVMGALVSVLMIWVLTGVLVYLAILRVIKRERNINADIMMIVAGTGVAVNILMTFVLGPDDGQADERTISVSPSGEKRATQQNVNVRAAYIHVIGDMVQSFGVLTASFVIKFKPDYYIADPICTFVFSVIVLITTITVLRDALLVLMEGTPQGIDLDEIKSKLRSIKGVKGIHDLHVWSLTVGTPALSAHVDIENEYEAQRILSEALSVVEVVFNIKHSTIQLEKYQPRKHRPASV